MWLGVVARQEVRNGIQRDKPVEIHKMKQMALSVAGLQLTVFSQDIEHVQRPILALFILHGRGGTQEAMIPLVQGTLSLADAQGSRNSRDLIVITLVGGGSAGFPYRISASALCPRTIAIMAIEFTT